MTRAIGDLAADGLWRENPALVQMLGLCPLLAVSTSLVTGLGLGLATALVLIGSNTLVSLSRRLIQPELRILVFVLIIAALVTVVELVMHAWFNALYRALGIFVPLIVTNCLLLARAERFASRNAVLPALVDGIMMGAGFTVVLVALGTLRELIGQGSLFANADMLFGAAAADWRIELYEGFRLAVLPSGAFIAFGLFLALYAMLKRRLSTPATEDLELAGETSAG